MCLDADNIRYLMASLNESVFGLLRRLSTRRCPHLLLSTVLAAAPLLLSACCMAAAAVD